MSPLEAIDRTHVSLHVMLQTPLVKELPRTVSIPDFHIPLRKEFGIRLPSNEPKQLLQNPPPEDSLGGKEGESLGLQIEFQLRTENAPGTHPGPISPFGPPCQNILDDSQVLKLRVFSLVGKHLKGGSGNP